jgi:hypothetical protein
MDEDESITRIRTFTGQAFRAPAAAQPLLVLPPGFISLMPVLADCLRLEQRATTERVMSPFRRKAR